MGEITISIGTLVGICSGLAVIIGAIEAVRSFKVKRGLNFKVRLDQHDKDISEMKQDISKMKEKIGVIDHIANGIQSLLRSQMVDIYNQYHKKGAMPMWVKNSFDDCFRNYKSLGGNGFMDNIHEVVMGMPLTEDKNVVKPIKPNRPIKQSNKQSAKQGKSK